MIFIAASASSVVESTHPAYKAEHAVDLDSGFILSVELREARDGHGFEVDQQAVPGASGRLELGIADAKSVWCWQTESAARVGSVGRVLRDAFG